MAGKFEVYEDRNGKHRFRLKASNGQVVATGEAYESRAAAIKGCESVQIAAEGARVSGQSPSEVYYQDDGVPVSIYLQQGGPTEGASVVAAVEHLARQLGIDIVARDAYIRGSFFQKLRGKLAEPETMSALQERIDSLERAAEVKLLAAPESEANLNNAQAFAAVLTSISDEEVAAIQLGSLVIIKTPGTVHRSGGVYCKTLTASQLKLLNENPDLLRQPSVLLNELSPCDDDLRQLEGGAG